NGYRHHLFKVLLQRFAAEIGIRIVVAHYPPYCSKYNPIEREDGANIFVVDIGLAEFGFFLGWWVGVE
ncbi:MAG: hypothetical protein ACI95T_001177, partial [Flavobacteriales bacterium]